MTDYSLPYGRNHILFSFKPDQNVELIQPREIPGVTDPIQEVVHALRHPVDGGNLDQFKKSKTVAIAINDKTRPVPHHFLLPPLLAELQNIGFERENIRLIIATGTHKPMLNDEFSKIIPEDIVNLFTVISHDCDDISNLSIIGSSSKGTPIEVNKIFVESDLKIVVGNIEPHHFSGFSGGYKSAVIGLGSRRMINKNHAMLMDENAKIAEFDNNPLRQDIEEIGETINVNFALNTVLNSEKSIVKCFAGNPHAVIKSGIPLSREVCQTMVKRKVDLVIASVGGAPKDINLYQSQKALSHASLLTKDGGVVILVAACPEGSGSKYYEDFMNGVRSPQQALEKFKQMEFRVGPHKAFQFSRELTRIRVILISEMNPDLVDKLLLEPAQNINIAIEKAEKYLPENYSIAIMPHATNTIPLFQSP
jgi:nickel-dependent lactate racemase